jgi:hypothetical protein
VPVEGATLEDALNGLGRVEPAAASWGVERHDAVPAQPDHISAGDSTTPIRRVLLLVHTVIDSIFGGGQGTESAIEIEIIAAGKRVLKQEIADTSQPDL